jgi:hypothetical protein
VITPVKHDWQRRDDRDTDYGRVYQCSRPECMRYAMMPPQDPRDPRGFCNVPGVANPVRLADGRTGKVGLVDMIDQTIGLHPYRPGDEKFPIESFRFEVAGWVQQGGVS